MGSFLQRPSLSQCPVALTTGTLLEQSSMGFGRAGGQVCWPKCFFQNGAMDCHGLPIADSNPPRSKQQTWLEPLWPVAFLGRRASFARKGSWLSRFWNHCWFPFGPSDAETIWVLVDLFLTCKGLWFLMLAPKQFCGCAKLQLCILFARSINSMWQVGCDIIVLKAEKNVCPVHIACGLNSLCTESLGCASRSKSFCDAKESRCRAATSATSASTTAKEPGTHWGGKIRILWSCDMLWHGDVAVAVRCASPWGRPPLCRLPVAGEMRDIESSHMSHTLWSQPTWPQWRTRCRSVCTPEKARLCWAGSVGLSIHSAPIAGYEEALRYLGCTPYRSISWSSWISNVAVQISSWVSWVSRVWGWERKSWDLSQGIAWYLNIRRMSSLSQLHPIAQRTGDAELVPGSHQRFPPHLWRVRWTGHCQWVRARQWHRRAQHCTIPSNCIQQHPTHWGSSTAGRPQSHS